MIVIQQQRDSTSGHYWAQFYRHGLELELFRTNLILFILQWIKCSLQLDSTANLIYEPYYYYLHLLYIIEQNRVECPSFRTTFPPKSSGWCPLLTATC